MIVPSGIRGDVVVALSLHPTPMALRGTARRLGRILEEHPDVAVDLAAVEPAGPRVAIVVTVTLGSVDDVKAGAERARAATRLLARLVRELASADPALVPVPDPAEPGAARARRLATGFDSLLRGSLTGTATGASTR